MSVISSDLPSGLAGFVDRHQVPLACGVSVCLLLALHYGYAISEVLYDAAYYWNLARPDVLGQASSHRGYLFPAMLMPLHLIADSLDVDPLRVLKLGLAMAYGITLPILLPAVFVGTFGGKVGFWRRLIPVVLLMQLFPGLLLYPLSDLPALLMLLAGLWCVMVAVRAGVDKRRFLGLMFLGGLLIAAAYNTRTIYLFGLIGMLVLLALRQGFVRQLAYPRMLALAAFAAGALVLSLPQLVINKRTQGVFSLAVIAQVGNYGLFASQMAWGMTLQRYETTAPGAALVPGVYYIDPAGKEIFNSQIAHRNPFRLRDYIAIVLSHPLDFLALYTRHAINGLDLRDGLVYARKLSSLRDRTAVFNFCVLALACWVIFAVRRQYPRGPGYRSPAPGWHYALLILLLPVLAIVPGAIETRFFAPVHLLAYCVIAFHFDAASIGTCLRKDRLTLAVTTSLAASIFFGVTFATMASQQFAWPPLYQLGPPR